jgi:hypothetical protein
MPITAMGEVIGADQALAAMNAVLAFRQLRTCRRTRPGQLCAQQPTSATQPGNPAIQFPRPGLTIAMGNADLSQS